MKARVSLHVHDSNVSPDSNTPPEKMVEKYKELGFDAVGFVGHDEESTFESDELLILRGIEHTISRSPEVHVVEFPQQNFSFLAHPQRMLSSDTKGDAMEIIIDMAIDGVEKFNNGFTQFGGSLPVPMLANDDAHNTLQAGSSFMEVNVDKLTRKEIIRAVGRGDVEFVNNRRSIMGQGLKAFNIGKSKTSGLLCKF